MENWIQGGIWTRCGWLVIAAVGALSAKPAAADGAPGDCRFGAMTHFAHGWDPVWADIAAIRGVRAVRDELYWNAVEPEKGVFQFPAAYDRYMEALRCNGISPLIVLSFGNPNYDSGDTPHTDEAFTAFGRYGTEVLKHYGDQIQAVEIWNEYNGTFCQGPATADRAGAYTAMLQAAYAQIKALRPDVTVVGGATTGIPLPYWEKLAQDGALQAMDALSIHPYRYNSPPEGIEVDIAALQDLVKKYNGGRAKPIWITEIGWETQTADVSGTLAIDEATRASFLVRAYALLLASKVERVYWYLLRDYDGLTMGMMTSDATPKLASYAFQVMAAELTDAPFSRRDPSDPSVYSIVFVRPSGEEVRVMWALHPVSILTDGVTRMIDMQGRPLPISGQITLTDAPLFVEGTLSGLPPPAPDTSVVIADSRTGFSGVQGGGGWSFGQRVGAGEFAVAAAYAVTDWADVWGGAYPYLSITSADQHPSVTWDGIPVAAVRRWTSDRDANLHVSGQFCCGPGGDGVGVSVTVDGVPVFRELLGGGGSVLKSFDFDRTVRAGSTIDFVVDPGPAANIDFDASQVTATISTP